MKHNEKTYTELPSARKIKRDCSKELYRAIKRMKVYITPDKLEKAELAYAKWVATHYMKLRELGQQRRNQLEWWEESCSKELSELLELDHQTFVTAFRHAYLSQ